MTKFPKGALYHWVQWVRFALQKVKRQSKFTLPFFCFSKKVISECLRATQWKFDFRPSEKPLFSIWFHENFNYRVLLLLKTRAKRVPFLPLLFFFAFWGLGLAPIKEASSRFLNGSEKVPSVCPCSMLLKSLVFLRHLLKIAPDVTKWSQKSWALAKTEGNFHEKLGF